MSADTQPTCGGSLSASFTTEGISDGHGKCAYCGGRFTIIPAGTGTRFTRRDIPVIDFHAPAVSS